MAQLMQPKPRFPHSVRSAQFTDALPPPPPVPPLVLKLPPAPVVSALCPPAPPVPPVAAPPAPLVPLLAASLPEQAETDRSIDARKNQETRIVYTLAKARAWGQGRRLFCALGSHRPPCTKGNGRPLGPPVHRLAGYPATSAFSYIPSRTCSCRTRSRPDTRRSSRNRAPALRR